MSLDSRPLRRRAQTTNTPARQLHSVPDDTPQEGVAAEADAPLPGSLCTGYGGLDLGVLAAFGSSRIAWCADPDPSHSPTPARAVPGGAEFG